MNDTRNSSKIQQPLTICDGLSLRLKDLAELLCGALVAAPGDVIPQLKAIPLHELNRPPVERFLQGCHDNLGEILTASTQEEVITILTGIAVQAGVFIDFVRWQARYSRGSVAISFSEDTGAIVDDYHTPGEIARQTIIKIRELLITRRSILDVQGYLSELEREP